MTKVPNFFGFPFSQSGGDSDKKSVDGPSEIGVILFNSLSGFGVPPLHGYDAFLSIRSPTNPLLLWSRCLMVLTLLVGCSDSTQTPVIRFGLANAPANLDPRFSTDAASARINRLLYARLVDFDDAARPIPSLADWTELTPTHYRFVLRNNIPRFHDNQPVTSQDVKATYQYILNPAMFLLIAGR